jgi:hypothetical protein
MQVHGSLIGTARYASINAHKGVELSRRDDLEALGYMLVYFLRGSLPWQGIKVASGSDRRYAKILAKKMSTRVEDLCSGCPQEFEKYLNYCLALRFDDRPDYGYLRRIFKDLCFRLDPVRGDSLVYDWTPRLNPQYHIEKGCDQPKHKRSIFGRLFGMIKHTYAPQENNYTGHRLQMTSTMKTSFDRNQRI